MHIEQIFYTNVNFHIFELFFFSLLFSSTQNHINFFVCYMRTNHIIILAAALLGTVSTVDILTPTVLSPSKEYVRLLNHSILFFEAQRAGKLPENNRVPWYLCKSNQIINKTDTFA